MSSFSSAAGPAPGGAYDGPHPQWAGRCSGRMRWKPLEIVAIVLGFMFYWPIGVALIGLKIAQRRGYSFDDAVTAFKDKVGGFSAQNARSAQWRPFASSGNSAFDEWRKSELERLEEERRKLDAAQREFADHLNNLRRAKDREEFERFMNARNSQGPSPTGPA
jgi:hypothetical protein